MLFKQLVQEGGPYQGTSTGVGTISHSLCLRGATCGLEAMLFSSAACPCTGFAAHAGYGPAIQFRCHLRSQFSCTRRYPRGIDVHHHHRHLNEPYAPCSRRGRGCCRRASSAPSGSTEVAHGVAHPAPTEFRAECRASELELATLTIWVWCFGAWISRAALDQNVNSPMWPSRVCVEYTGTACDVEHGNVHHWCRYSSVSVTPAVRVA